jgi:type IV pilus assembly protein PilB
LTGHLVLTTLHTNDTAGSLPRLINMGVEPFLITSAVDLVVAQRLVRVVCPKCKEEIKIPPKLIDEIKRELDQIPQNNLTDRSRIPKEIKFFYGRGCNECTGGYKGRIGMFEVMRMTPKIEDLAVSRRPSNEIFLAAKEDGMITLRQDGILKALSGVTTIDEVLQAAING